MYSRILLSHKESETLLFAATENITLSDVRDRYYVISPVYGT